MSNAILPLLSSTASASTSAVPAEKRGDASERSNEEFGRLIGGPSETAPSLASDKLTPEEHNAFPGDQAVAPEAKLELGLAVPQTPTSAIENTKAGELAQTEKFTLLSEKAAADVFAAVPESQKLEQSVATSRDSAVTAVSAKATRAAATAQPDSTPAVATTNAKAAAGIPDPSANQQAKVLEATTVTSATATPQLSASQKTAAAELSVAAATAASDKTTAQASSTADVTALRPQADTQRPVTALDRQTAVKADSSGQTSASATSLQSAAKPEATVQTTPTPAQNASLPKADADQSIRTERFSAEPAANETVAPKLSAGTSTTAASETLMTSKAAEAPALLFTADGRPTEASSSVQQVQRAIATPSGTFVTQQGTADPARQVADAIRMRGNDQTISVRLDPPNLGSVTVDLNFDKARLVTATVAAEMVDTTQLLRRQLDSLQRELAAAGFEDVTVDVGQHQDPERLAENDWSSLYRTAHIENVDVAYEEANAVQSAIVNLVTDSGIDIRL